MSNLSSRRWAQRPNDSTWGDFGADDQLGRINLITPKKVLEGVGEVREGRTFCLSLPLDLPGGSSLNKYRSGPLLRPVSREPGEVFYNFPISGDRGVVSDDLVIMHLQYSTQWDALCHYGMSFDVDGSGERTCVYYNGFKAGTDVWSSSAPEDAGFPTGPIEASTSRANALGVENLATAGMQARGVLVDLQKHLGPGRTRVRYADLEQILRADGQVIGAGDIVLFHTGFAQRVLEMDGDPDISELNRTGAVLDGTDPELRDWIRDSQLSAIAADNYAVERPPHDADSAGPMLPIHELCLFRLGVPLGEMWHLTPLAAWLAKHDRTAFLLTAPPLRLPGAAGSPLTPIATV